MTDINIYPTEFGPFQFRYRYSLETNILEIEFHDPAAFAETATFSIRCYDLAGAYYWLDYFVGKGLDPEVLTYSGSVTGRHIPALVADLHQRSNSDPNFLTGWFAGNYFPQSYRVLEWDEFDIYVDLDEDEENQSVELTDLDGPIPLDVQLQLGYYVYALRDPRNSEVFYVGKGKGNRILQHVAEAGALVDRDAESRKLQRIKEIEASGHAVEHLFIRHGLDDETTAFIAEQAVIDGLKAAGLDLSNIMSGHHSKQFGLASLEAVLGNYDSEPLPAIDAPVIMLKINRKWKPDMSPAQVLDATHGYWKIGADSREVAQYALGVAFGVVRGVYRIHRWHESTIEDHVNRWWFEGEDAPEMNHLIGKHVKDAFVPGSSNPYQKFLNGYVAKS